MSYSHRGLERLGQLLDDIAKRIVIPPEPIPLPNRTFERALQQVEAIARKIGLLPELPGTVPTTTTSIGTTARDYSTITSWEADLDNGAVYSASDDALGECYNDSAFDESVTINGGGTIGLNSVTLSVASAERHDGTAGSGARVVRTASSCLDIQTPIGFDSNYHVKWLEIDMNDNNGPAVVGTSQVFQYVGSLQNMLIHDQVDGSSFLGLVSSSSRDLRIQNCVIYNNTRAATSTMFGINVDCDRTSGGIYNNTIYNIDNTSTGDCHGINIATNSANATVKNNIAMGTSSSSGTPLDFSFPGTSPDSDYNLSSDDTADDGGGLNNLISKTTSNQFVSITGGSEDLHLKSGADAIDAGTDLGTTPSGVEIDIDGRDRDANADTWDMGAHEYVAAGGGATIAAALTLLGVS